MSAGDDMKAWMDRVETRLSALEGVTPPVEPPVEPPVPPLPPLPATFEWTVLVPSADTRIYYVSIDGNDANDGLSPATPVRTPMVAYDRLRTGYPDWMLLRRGDAWDAQGTQFAFVGEGGRSGRSASEPIVIGSYGDSTARPRLLSGRFRPLDGDKHVACVGLEFQYANPLVTSNGISIIGSRVEDILIEDCAILGYPTNVQIDGQGKRPQNVRLRGCVVADSTGQGILASGVDGLLIDGCVFDHNGWREDVSGFPANGFNHNMYLSGTNTDVTVTRTISARASSHAISMSGGGVAEGNLVLQSPIGIWGHGKFRAIKNVVLDARDIGPETPRGMAIGADEFTEFEAALNIIAHARLGKQCQGIIVGGSGANALVQVWDNIVYDWTGEEPGLDPMGLYWYGTPHGEIDVDGNIIKAGRGVLVHHDTRPIIEAFGYYFGKYLGGPDESKWFRVVDYLTGLEQWKTTSGESSASVYVNDALDPYRTIETYHASLGREPTLAAFMAQARKQGRLTWQEQYTAWKVGDYIRAGFGR